jgi:glycosyltransferase involved in cell wall biosynthesis
MGANRTCDVLIASRQPAVVDDGADITAGARILWVHDVTCGPALNHKRNIRFDRILALSNWHRSILQRSYPLVDPAKILVTRNGIDLGRFDGKEIRNARRAIYSSSPDRGLEVLLDIWPVVRKSIPDAELHVFYGFDSWEATVATMGTAGENELKRIRHIKDKLSRTPGVRVRGRVGQIELAREFLRAGVWAYPTAFTETSCCTAMEAQAAGCRIVTSPLAALNETVGNRGQMIPGYGTPGYVDTFAAAVVMAMQEGIDRKLVDDRALLQEHARNSFSLDTLAEEWESMLITTLEDVRKRVVPAFHKAVVA